MHKEILEKYLNDPKVLYIYEIGLQIYGLFEGVEDRDFLLVCDNDYIPDFKDAQSSEEGLFGFEEIDNCRYSFRIIFIKDWFNEVLNNSMLAWECACLPKKYILKEHVKLLLQTNPLALRKTYEAITINALPYAVRLIEDGNTLTAQKSLWYLIKYVIFSNQIIENHKIVNFKEPMSSYKSVVDGTVSEMSVILRTFNEEMLPHLERFKKYTDGMLAKSKLKIINQDV